MSSVSLKIFYAKGMRLSLSDRTFREAMELVWQSDAFSKHTGSALKLTFVTGKMLYMDENAFGQYLNKEISQEQLIELTEIEELYRNKKEIITDEEFIIDAGHLFKLKKGQLILIDDDVYYDTKLDLKLFEIAD